MPPVIRAMLLERAKMRCEVCGQRVIVGQWDAHHRVQLSVGGHDELYNLLVVCRGCHNRIHDDLDSKSRTMGWLVDGWQDPLEVPVVMHDGRVYLDGTGGYTVLDR